MSAPSFVPRKVAAKAKPKQVARSAPSSSKQLPHIDQHAQLNSDASSGAVDGQNGNDFEGKGKGTARDRKAERVRLETLASTILFSALALWKPSNLSIASSPQPSSLLGKDEGHLREKLLGLHRDPEDDADPLSPNAEPSSTFLHISHLLQVPSIHAICSTLSELQQALELCLYPGGLIELSEDKFGFRLSAPARRVYLTSPASSSFHALREEIEERTIFFENIPRQNKSLVSAARYIHEHILQQDHRQILVTNLYYPAHPSGLPAELVAEQDESSLDTRKEASAPEKATAIQLGSAFAILYGPLELVKESIQHLCTDVAPWKRKRVQTVTAGESPTLEASDRSNLRCLSLSAWRQLRDEYLEHQQQLKAKLTQKKPQGAAQGSSREKQVFDQPTRKRSKGDDDVEELRGDEKHAGVGDAAPEQKRKKKRRKKDPSTSVESTSQKAGTENSHLEVPTQAKTYPESIILRCYVYSRPDQNKEAEKAKLQRQLNRSFPDMVNYVSFGSDHPQSSSETISAYIRCSCSEAAQHVLSSLSSRDRPDEFEELLPPDTSSVTLLTGTDEEEYWKALPLRVHNAARKKAQHASQAWQQSRS